MNGQFPEPEECREFVRTGPLTRAWVFYLAGAFCAVTPVYCLGLLGKGLIFHQEEIAISSPEEWAAFWALMLVLSTGSTVLFASQLLGRKRSAVAITSEDVYFRNWLGRVVAFPRSCLTRVAIRDDEMYRVFGKQHQVTVVMSWRGESGRVRKAKVLTTGSITAGLHLAQKLAGCGKLKRQKRPWWSWWDEVWQRD